MKLKKVCAVVVTYNRIKYLLKLLKSLKEQSYALSAILIFDNCSTDGTDSILKENGYCNSVEMQMLHSAKNNGIDILFYRNNENLGGSGGFHDAIKIASKLGYEFLWCMDDDVLPEKQCLEKLMLHMSNAVRICIPSRTDKNYRDYAIIDVNMSNPFKFSIVSRKKMIYNENINGNAIEVVDMPFEGPLIENKLIEEIGLPKKDFFIIFDDSEYAARACKVTKILYCKDAILHKQIIPHSGKDEFMNWKNYYGYRNQIWFDRHYGLNRFVKILRPRLLYIDLIMRAILRGKFSNINLIKRAYKDGVNDTLGKLVAPGTSRREFK